MSGTTWSNAFATGNWSTASDWIGGVEPTSGSVQIGTGTKTIAVDVTEDATVTISSLTLDGYNSSYLAVLTITSGGTLTVTDGVTLEGNKTGVDSAIEGTGTLVIDGAITGTGVISESSGTLDITGSGSSTTNVQLNITAGSGDVLELGLTGGVRTGTTVGLSANQTLQIDPNTNVTITVAGQTISGGTLQMAGGTLTDSTGLAVDFGSVTGFRHGRCGDQRHGWHNSRQRQRPDAGPVGRHRVVARHAVSDRRRVDAGSSTAV